MRSNGTKGKRFFAIDVPLRFVSSVLKLYQVASSAGTGTYVVGCVRYRFFFLLKTSIQILLGAFVLSLARNHREDAIG